MSVLKKCHAVADTDDLGFILPKGRMTWTALAKKFKGKDADADDEGSFSVAFVFPADADFKLLVAAVNAVANAKWPVKKGEKPINMLVPATHKGLRSPFLKADEKESAEALGVETLEDCLLLRANSYRGPIPVRTAGGDLVPVDEYEVEAFTGRNARMEIKIATYDQPKNKGVKFYLQGVQVLSGGAKLKEGAGGGSAENFGAVEDDDEDPLG
jgi:hypothetical protein